MSAFLSDLRRVLARVGIPSDRQDAVVTALCHEFGGSAYYWPRFDRRARAASIRGAVQAGETPEAVCQRLNITRKTFDRIADETSNA